MGEVEDISLSRHFKVSSHTEGYFYKLKVNGKKYNAFELLKDDKNLWLEEMETKYCSIFIE